MTGCLVASEWPALATLFKGGSHLFLALLQAHFNLRFPRIFQRLLPGVCITKLLHVENFTARAMNLAESRRI